MEQHLRYGDFVRVAPNHVSINNHDAVAEIYGHRSGCTKSDFYDAFLQVTPVLFNARDPKSHQKKRKYVAPAFSTKALADYEPSMDSEMLGWKKKLVGFATSDAHLVDFAVWTNYLAFDVIGSFAFGTSFGFVEEGKDNYNLISTIDKRGEVLNALGTVPTWLRPWMRYNYFDSFWSSGLRATSNLETIGRRAYAQRKNSAEPQKDLLSYLFQAQKSEDLGEREIIAESISFIVGGSDTTSSTMTNVIDFVSRDEELQGKLQHELDNAFPGTRDEDWIPDHHTLQNLPLLNATLREVMRVRPTSATGLERIVPSGGKTIAGVYFPAGTIVSVPSSGLMSDERIFKDAASFRPERWLEPDAKDLLEFFLPFSTGPRACVGRNFAWMEILKSLAIVFKLFNVRRSKAQATVIREGFFQKAAEWRGRILEFLSKLESLPDFSRDAAGLDKLFETDYEHTGKGATCLKCSAERTVPREARTQQVVVHHGTIASGNQVIKDAALRDKLSEDLGGVLLAQKQAMAAKAWAGQARRKWSIFWAPAVSMESFEQACAEIARALNISQAADSKDDVKELVKARLSLSRAGRWLMVVDNADDPDIFFGTEQSKGVVDYLPASEGGVTVYTTRTPEVAEKTRGDVIRLEAMDRRDAREFFTKSLVAELDDTTSFKLLDELLDELTCLPLAIAQAAAYLNRNRMPIAKYLELLRSTEQDLVSVMSREFRDDTRYRNSANAVATTWVVSFSQIRKQNSLAASLLEFMSVVEWKAIPRSLLPSVQSQVEMEEAIGTLCGYSFLARRDSDDRATSGETKRARRADKTPEADELYDIHRLVHLATKIWIQEYRDASGVVEDALRHVADVFPWSDWKNRTAWRAYLPHAMHLLAAEHNDDNIKENSELGLRIDGQHALATAYQADGQITQID
ncbi:hypothetical protein N0V95_008936 [Ascochyta clinopodiicola]|nr:hypothetical protein N0V95_008936 [Ascochyta clinopodiicola]